MGSHGRQMKTIFLFTIDVESRTYGNPHSNIFGILPGYEENYGIEKIMDILEAYQIRGTFFLNTYEAAKYGGEIIGKAARMIHVRGHDLELHTHPRPAYSYYGMSDAPREDQIAILNAGKAFLKHWTGKDVMAHRAGAFRANMDTLRAVEATGLLADCSLSPGSRVHMPLVNDLGVTNLVRRIGKVWEIPVTYYHQLRVGRWHSKRILDIEGSTLPEIKRVTRWALQEGLPTICILMHSFSLCRRGKPNRRVIRRFASLLAWLQKQYGIEIGTIEQVCERLTHENVSSIAIKETNTGLLLTLFRSLLMWNDGWRNRLIALMGLIGITILMLTLLHYGLMN